MSGAHRARKRFGQHFLTSATVIDDIVNAVAANSDDTLVEIGPGQGAITVPLAMSGAKLHAIEFDRDLISPLRKKFAAYDNVVIHEADALNFDFGSLGTDLRIIGNLPYNISTPLLFHLTQYLDHMRDLYVMLQKEVVDRMAAGPGSKSYGRLSIMLGCQMQIVSLFDVPPDSFSPPPKVMSAVAALRPLPAGDRPTIDLDHLSRLVSGAFSKRRKTLRNALQGIVTVEEMEGIGIDPGKRPEQLSIEQWLALGRFGKKIQVT